MTKERRDKHRRPEGGDPRGEKVHFTTPRSAKVKEGRGAVRRWKDGSGLVRVGRRTVELMLGESDRPVEEWTDEELMWGVSRLPNGKAPTTLPTMIPMAVYQELVKRMTTKVMFRFAAELTMAAETHIKIISDKKTPSAVKLKAIEMLYERILGRPTEHLVLEAGDEPWRKMITQAIVGTVDQIEDKESEIIEGEVIDIASTTGDSGQV